jgi:hypothetical protein
MGMIQDQEAVGLWEQSLTMLSDTVYMDIVRNFIGKIPTPFHKPQLTKRLTNLFLNPQFRHNIIEMLSKQDIQLLSATHILGSPTQDEVCAIFEGRLPYAILLNNLVNLEERLLLVPNPYSTNNRCEILVNPILLDLLQSKALSYASIFASIDSESQSQGFRLSGANPSILQALVSLHIHESLGSVEKSSRLLKNKYGPLVFGTDKNQNIDEILYYNRLLFHENIIRPDGRGFRIDWERSERLLRLDRHQLQLRLFISAWHTNFPSQGKTQISDNSLHVLFSDLVSFLRTIPLDTEEDLETACKFVAFRNRISLPDTNHIVAILRQIGLSDPVSQEIINTDRGSTRLTPTIDSDFSISFSNDLETIGSRNILHMIAIARKVDVVSSYEINKQSIMRGFDLGLSVDGIISYLKDLTHTDFKHLENLIKHWRDEFNSITIYDGIIVKADERQSRIIEALPQLQEHIIATISTGLFLLSRSSEIIWREILTATGIGFLPSSITEKVQPDRSHEYFDFQELETHTQQIGLLPLHVPKHQDTALSNPSERLKKSILSKTSNPSEREEMLARLERKLIIVPEQITAIQGPSQTMQASGFDYQGKINLCKAAVNSSSDLLELHLLDDMGNSQMILADAKEFITSAKDPSIRVQVLPEGEERLISLNTLFKVRKLRRSVFFQM